MGFIKKYLSFFIPIILVPLLFYFTKYSSNWLYLVALLAGSLVGLALFQIDHLIYVFFTNSHELTSQRAIALANAGQWKKLFNLLIQTSYERKDLIFHKVWFQILFFFLTLFAISSSSNSFGKGVAIGFFVSSIISLVKSLPNNQSIDAWLSGIPQSLKLGRNHIIFYILIVLILLALSMLVY